MTTTEKINRQKEQLARLSNEIKISIDCLTYLEYRLSVDKIQRLDDETVSVLCSIQALSGVDWKKCNAHVSVMFGMIDRVSQRLQVLKGISKDVWMIKSVKEYTKSTIEILIWSTNVNDL